MSTHIKYKFKQFKPILRSHLAKLPRLKEIPERKIQTIYIVDYRKSNINEQNNKLLNSNLYTQEDVQ